MMASSTDSVWDFGHEPKRKIATYGRAGRRRTDGSRPATLRHAESAPAIPTAFTKPQSRSPEPPSAPRGVGSTKARQKDTGKYGVEVRQRATEESHSQPLPDLYDFDSLPADVTRTKKRRIAREPSDKAKLTGPYSTPDPSPPGARSPVLQAEKGITRPGGNTSASSVSRRTTPERDADMEDDEPALLPFSVKTSRTLKNLRGGTGTPGPKKQQIPIRLSAQVPSQTNAVPRRLTRLPTAPAIAQIRAPVSQQQVRKRRLIDTLAAQAEDEPNSSDDEAATHKPDAQSSDPPPAVIRSSTPPSSSVPVQPTPKSRPVMSTKKTGPKFTYSQQRTMLADDDPLLGGAAFGDLGDASTGGALFNLGRLTKSATLNAFSYMDEDDETANTGAVRSIHELRQAGANSRFADEMDDILDRVGAPSPKPSSLRRGALLELAKKMKHKEFRQQFRNHGEGASLFRSLGDESDLISAYAILAIITTLLAATTSAHLIQQLRSQGLSTLISKLLKVSADIAQVARDKKQNVSRNGQQTLTTLNASLLELPVWDPLLPTSLSPRTLSLKCIDLLMRQLTFASAEDAVLSEAVTDRLFSILADGASKPTCWNSSNQPAACDFHLALYLLEAHSISAMQPALSATWTEQYAPIIADVLEAALERPTDQLGDLAGLALRLSLNVTNHNGEASRLFVEKGLLKRLANAACDAFALVVSSMKADSFLSKVLESLIMMLGAMINFCVYYPPASETLEDGGDSPWPPLDRLIRVFAENHATTAEADSMEKTQLNVALGYLSILLGYLCLTDSARERFALVHPKKSIRPLLDSVNEFIAFHRKVAEVQAEEGAKQDSESASLNRLEGLADQLSALC